MDLIDRLRPARLQAWIDAREPSLTVIGAACAFVMAFATTWIAIQ
jgi:hypothetical protein